MIDINDTEVRMVEYQVRRPRRAGARKRRGRRPGGRAQAGSSPLEELARMVERPVHRPCEGQILVEVEGHSSARFGPRFGLGGDSLPSRCLFPSREWGTLPFWGFGRIAESRCAGIRHGQWLWGVFPSATHVVLTPGDVAPGSFVDAAPRRRGLPLLYRAYRRMLLPPLGAGSGPRAWEAGEQALLAALFADWLREQRWFGAGRAVFLLPECRPGMSVVHRTSQDTSRPGRVDALVWPNARGPMLATEQFGLVRAYDDFSCLANLCWNEGEGTSVVVVDANLPDEEDRRVPPGPGLREFLWEQAADLFGSDLAAIAHLSPGRVPAWIRRLRVPREVLRPLSPAAHFEQRAAGIGVQNLLDALPGAAEPLWPPLERRIGPRYGRSADSDLGNFAERAGLVVSGDPEVIAS